MNASINSNTLSALASLPALLVNDEMNKVDRQALRSRAAAHARTVRIPALLRRSSTEEVQTVQGQ